LKPEIAEELYNEILTEWIARHGKEKLDPEKLEATRQTLLSLPEDKVYKSVVNMSTGKTHLVPIKDIILNGLRGWELDKYPVIDEKKLE
jgi:hypothetical protein